MRRLFPLGVATLFAVCPVASPAQAWLLDRAVAPEIYHLSRVTSGIAFAPGDDGRILVYGEFSHVNERSTGGFARINASGALDETFTSGLAAGERVAVATRLRDGRILAVVVSGAVTPFAPGALGMGGPVAPLGFVVVPVEAQPVTSPGETPDAPRIPISTIVRFLADGRRDPSFAPLACDGLPRLLPLADGRVIAWGSFRTLGGQARNSLARLEADGRLDASFAPVFASGPVVVTAAAPAPNGSVVASGFSYESSSRTAYFFTRLNEAGSADPAFAAATPSGSFTFLAAQPDGRVVAGDYTLFRYTTTGALDPTFTLQIPARERVNRLVPLGNGRMLVEASAGTADNYLTPGVFIVDADGRVETDLRTRTGAQNSQRLLAVLPDGNLLLLQASTVFAVASRGPLPTDGSTTSTTNATASPNATVQIYLGPSVSEPSVAVHRSDANQITTLAVEIAQRRNASLAGIKTDTAGRATISGAFTHVDGERRPGLARIRADGTLDRVFAPAGVDTLLLVPPDGRPIVKLANGRLARLRDDGSADPAFAVPGELDDITFLASAPDGRLLVAAFDGGRSESTLKLIWLRENGQRLATLPTQFGGFAYWAMIGVITLPADTPVLTTGTSSVIADAGAIAAAVNALPPPIFSAVDAPPATVTPGDSGNTQPVTPTSPVVPIGTPPWSILVVPQPIAKVEILSGDRLVVTGSFRSVAGSSADGVVWLKADGSVDAPPSQLTNPATNVAVSASASDSRSYRPLPDGRALRFDYGWTGVGGARTTLTRVDREGRVDAAFEPPWDITNRNVFILGDSSLLIGNQLYAPSGALDANFQPQLRASSAATTIATAARAGNFLWLGGSFTQVDGQPRFGLARYETREVIGITFDPQTQGTVAGRDVTFSVVLGTNQPAAVQWTRNGAPLAGATGTTLRIADPTASDVGDYRAVVTIGGQTFTSAPASLSVAPNTAQLINFSARSHVTPAAPQVAGFVVANPSTRDALLRATGRGLPVTGVATEGFVNAPFPFPPLPIRTVSFASWVLPVPVLTVHNATGPIASDRGGGTSVLMNAMAREAGAFALRTYSGAAPDVVYGSAVGAPLTPGAYTAITTSGDGGTGESLFEFYDPARGAGARPLLRNLAVRARVASGSTLTCGFVIAGNGPRRMLVRGAGPALAAFGLADAIADPQLRLLGSNGATLANNPGWANDPALAAAAARAGAFPFAAGSRDTALVVKLEPGSYTAEVASAARAAGTAMIEIYVLEP